MTFGNGGWHLDLERLAARSRRARARSSSSRRPIRPAGPRREDDLRVLLALARAHGLWIIADEIYARFVYDGGGAARRPSST